MKKKTGRVQALRIHVQTGVPTMPSSDKTTRAVFAVRNGDRVISDSSETVRRRKELGEKPDETIAAASLSLSRSHILVLISTARLFPFAQVFTCVSRENTSGEGARRSDDRWPVSDTIFSVPR